jgi:site-specific DNA-methyltransferase (cytosine-N4-specific)
VSAKKPNHLECLKCGHDLSVAAKDLRCGECNHSNAEYLKAKEYLRLYKQTAHYGKRYNENLTAIQSAKLAADNFRAFVHMKTGGIRGPTSDRGLTKAMPNNCEVKLILGDALKEVRKLPSDHFDLCFTSPPFFAKIDYETDVGDDYGTIDDLPTYLDVMTTLFSEARRVVKPTGTLLIEIGDGYSASNKIKGGGLQGKVGNLAKSDTPQGSRYLVPHRLAPAIADSGWICRQEIITTKPTGEPNADILGRPMTVHTPVYAFGKTRHVHYERYPDTERSVWELQTRNGLAGTADHPCPFQSDLCRKGVLAFSPEGGRVLDPFCGTAQTGIAAVENGRHFVGIDASKKWLGIARKRLFKKK